MFDLFRRLSRCKAERALVIATEGVPRPQHVIGIIAKDHIANAVLENLGG